MSRFCRTTLNYIPRPDEAEDGGGAKSRAGHGGGTEVEILNGRAVDLPGWAECGFELVSHPSAVSDWGDDAAIVRTHYPEIEALAKAMTGADHALVSRHIKRNPVTARDQHAQLSPITFVHSDFAAGHDGIIRNSYSGDSEDQQQTLRRHGIDASVVSDASRIVILQFWRNLGPAKMDYPLAFCDSRSIQLEHGRAFRVNNYAGTGATFDALAVTAQGRDEQAHCWYAFPELRPDEAVAFRTYDTDLVAAGEVYFTPHSAFRDPEVEVGRPARSSIELRATCVYA